MAWNVTVMRSIYLFFFSNFLVRLAVNTDISNFSGLNYGSYPGNTRQEARTHSGWDACPLQSTMHIFTHSFAARAI